METRQSRSDILFPDMRFSLFGKYVDVNVRALTSGALYLLFAALTLQFFAFAVEQILVSGYFVDEIVNTEAPVRFFRELNYTSHILPLPFDPRISSGIISTTPGGLGWTVFDSLAGARFVNVFYVWLMSFAVFLGFFRSKKYSIATSMAATAIAWHILGKLPYSFGYMYNLGEIHGAIWVAVGCLLLCGKPRLSFFCFGLAVWGCKLIYLPLALALICAFYLDKGLSRKNIPHLLFFFLPLLAWMAIIFLRFGSSELIVWIGQYLGTIKTGKSGLDKLPNTFSLFKRLSDPSLEWAGYNFEVKRTIVLVLLGGIFAPFLRFIKTSQRDPHPAFSLFLSGVVLFYSSWYFLWHPFMWIRHLQPAMYLSFGAILFFGLIFIEEWFRAVPPRVQARLNRWRFVIPVILLFSIFKVISQDIPKINAASEAMKFNSQSFASRCRDNLESSNCR